MSSNDEEFQITAEELEKFRNALKKKEFRDLLTEYVKEIEDPVNKKKYEDEIIEMERKRGQNVKFINPTPGFVIRVYLEPGHRKVFINICLSEVIAVATCVPAKVAGSKKSGTEWQIPYSLCVARDDLDKSGKRCMVYDCVYHPKTYQRAQKYARFKQLLVDTAVEAVETQEKAKIAPGKIKYLSMPYKGRAQSSIVREAISEEERPQKKAGKGAEDDLPFGVVYPPLKDSTSKKSHKDPTTKKKKDPLSPPSPPSPPSPTEPSYTVKYRGEVAMDDYTNDRVSQIVKRPKEIIVIVKLPRLSSVETVELDVLQKQLLLNNKDPPYHLDLALSYPVDQNKGQAEFNKTEKALTVTLPVLPPSHPPTLPPPLPPPLPPSHAPSLPSCPPPSHPPSHDSHPPSLPPSLAPCPSHTHPPSPPPSPITELTNNLQSCDTDTQSGEESTNQIAVEQNSSGVNEKGSNITSSDDLTNQNAASEDSHMTWMSKGEWSAPLFTYRQDNERVVFVLHSPSIKTSTVVHHYDNHQFQVMYSCGVDDSKQTANHSLLVGFHDDDIIDNTSVDISDENMVVIVTKADGCQRMWEWFEAGPHSQLTERKSFMNKTTVNNGIEEMEKQCDIWNSPPSQVKVSSSSHDTVDLDITTIEKSSEQSQLNKRESIGDSVAQVQDSTVENTAVPCNGHTSASTVGSTVGSTSDSGPRCEQHTGLQLTNELLFDLD